jgi:hypothetical protein
MTTPTSIHGFASVPSPFTHPMIVCSVVEPPCAATPAVTAAARATLARTVSFMTPPLSRCLAVADRRAALEPQVGPGFVTKPVQSLHIIRVLSEMAGALARAPARPTHSLAG